MEPANWKDWIQNRRSIRRFQKRALSEEQIGALIEAGQYAPTGMNAQNTLFIAVQNPQIKKKLSELNAEVMRQANPQYQGDPFYGADTVIAVLADTKRPTWIQDGSTAMENTLLAADAMGLGGCWINRAKEVFDLKEGRALLEELGIAPSFQGVAFAAIGYPEGERPAAAKRTSQVRILL